mmetsp:Transcript_31530/g.31254  ORF Transcript_31530/g.31254 Transcript_31530/m.31254 type:complete len:220 (+) Transcript_31530:34-693(+)
MGCCGTRTEYEGDVNKLDFFIANDYKELEDKEAGVGIKRTQAWQATITGEELRRKREEFWCVQKTGHRHIWLYIRQAAEADAETAKAILEMAEIKLEKDTMSVCIDPEGNRYYVPPFMINDPLFPPGGFISKKIVKQEIIKLKGRISSSPNDIEVEIDNTKTGRDLKLIISEKNGIQTDKMRLFFGGKEIREHDSLISCNIEDGMVFQVFYRPKPRTME